MNKNVNLLIGEFFLGNIPLIANNGKLKCSPPAYRAPWR